MVLTANPTIVETTYMYWTTLINLMNDDVEIVL